MAVPAPAPPNWPGSRFACPPGWYRGDPRSEPLQRDLGLGTSCASASTVVVDPSHPGHMTGV